MPSQEATISVPFAELDGSPIESIGPDGVQLVRRFRVGWDNTPTFIREVLGNASDADGEVTRVLPMRYDEDRFPNAFAIRARIEPFGGAKAGIVTAATGTTTNSYAKAVVEVEYAPQEVDQIEDPEDSGGGGGVSDPLVSESIELGAEFLTIEAEGMTWYAPEKGWDGSAIGPGVSISKIMPLMEWTVTRRKVPRIPDAVFASVGHVNSAVLRSATFRRSFKKYNALYLGASISRGLNVFGRGDFEISAKFAIRSGGQADESEGTWQETFNPREGEWARIAKAGFKQDIYPEADLNPVVGVFTT